MAINYPVDTLNIRLYRGLEDLRLEGFGGFNLLVGQNNAGKTSILESLHLLANPFDWPRWLEVATSRDIRLLSDMYPRVEMLKWLFRRQSGDSSFEGEIAADLFGPIGGRVRARSTEIIGFPPVTSFSRSRRTGYVEEEEAGLAVYVDWESYVGSGGAADYTFWESGQISRGLGKRGKTALILPETHRSTAKQIRLYSNASLNHFRGEAIEAVRLLDPDVVGIELISPRGSRRPIPYIHHDRLGLAPLNAFGDGFRRTLTLALTLASVPGGLLLIDEIETALHRDALVKVFSWLVAMADRMNVQIVATTHSLEAVDAILEAEKYSEGEVVAFRLSRLGSRTIATRFSGRELLDIRNESGMDVR